ncbi:MAG: SEC-C metal-binding domain-containing protein [Verrucomicrobia bacterium]|nr:SEC-C metal-binding domain-containing protein [Verrucomicrobiota bacterium]
MAAQLKAKGDYAGEKHERSFRWTDDTPANFERTPHLNAIDRLWQEHISGINSPRNSIGLPAYGQRDPLIDYKAQAFKLFDALMVNIKSEICRSLFRSASSRMAFEQFLHNRPQTPAHETAAPFQDPASLAESSNGFTEANEGLVKAQLVGKDTRIGRNDLCPCGRGKNYKACGRSVIRSRLAGIRERPVDSTAVADFVR